MVIIIVLAISAYICGRIIATNIDVPPEAEKPMSARERLHFAIDNDLPIN